MLLIVIQVEEIMAEHELHQRADHEVQDFYIRMLHMMWLQYLEDHFSV